MSTRKNSGLIIMKNLCYDDDDDVHNADDYD